MACPNSSGYGVFTLTNAGTPTGGQASFPTSCFWYVPQGISHSPVMFTHYINPVYSGDQNFLGPYRADINTAPVCPWTHGANYPNRQCGVTNCCSVADSTGRIHGEHEPNRHLDGW